MALVTAPLSAEVDSGSAVVDLTGTSSMLIELPDLIVINDDLSYAIEYNFVVDGETIEDHLKTRGERLTGREALLLPLGPSQGSHESCETPCDVEIHGILKHRATRTLSTNTLRKLQGVARAHHGEFVAALSLHEAVQSPKVSVRSQRIQSKIVRRPHLPSRRRLSRFSYASAIEVSYFRSPQHATLVKDIVRAPLEIDVHHPSSVSTHEIVAIGSFQLKILPDVDLRRELAANPHQIAEMTSFVQDRCTEAFLAIERLLNRPFLGRQANHDLRRLRSAVENWRQNHDTISQPADNHQSAADARIAALREWQEIERIRITGVDVTLTKKGDTRFTFDSYIRTFFEISALRFPLRDPDSAGRRQYSSLVVGLGLIQLLLAFRLSSVGLRPSWSFLASPEATKNMLDTMDASVALLTLLPGALFIQSLYTTDRSLTPSSRHWMNYRSLCRIGCFPPLCTVATMIGTPQPRLVTLSLLACGVASVAAGVLARRFSSEAAQARALSESIRPKERRSKKR